MKTWTRVAPVVIAVAVIALVWNFAASDATKEERPGLLRHVVAFKFKEEATQAQIDEVTKAFENLENEIPFIVDFEWGTNVSPEGLDKGFTHLFFMTFKTAADRDAYIPHPAHKAFVETLPPVLDEAFVIDYWTK